MNSPETSPESRRHLLGDDVASLAQWLAADGQPRFRADQILQWIYEHGVGEFEAMSNLSKSLRAWLAENAVIYTSSVPRESVAEDSTRKLLLEFPDGATAETVWIPSDDRHTACLSTQAGCPVGCLFCASGLGGFQRNLTAGEIVEQALRIRQLIAAAAAGEFPRLSNIVVMGMGEPLANYEATIAAIRILNAPWGGGIGARKITLSTIGLPKQIRRLAEEELQLNLALSLHAPDDGLRAELIPWARGVSIKDLIDACTFYFERTGREITLEYVLLDGVNDSAEQALGLGRIAKRLRANVNLLRYNPVAGAPFRRPSAESAYEFQQKLRKIGVNVHVRKSRGKDADAACGQLRRAANEDGNVE